MEGSKKPRRATRPWITLRNDAAAVALDAAGGSIASFVLGDGVNPLSWDSAVHDQQDVEKTAPRPLGHFLCLDRWGPPSVAEEAQGMPYHGEASSRHWHVVELDSPVVRLEAQLPMAGLAVERRLELVKCQAARRAVDAPQGGAAVLAAVLKVQDEVKNINQLGRIFNMVQHPSIAAPFLSAETRVDCNGKRGFTQGPRGCAEVLWHAPREFPAAVTARDGVRDAHGMTGGADDVFSYEVDPKETYGWVCASTPSQGLLLGYVWPRAEYPWVSLWCSSEVDGDQRPRARGLEFGTTGLHQPFPILTKHPRIFDLPTFEHLDAAPSSTRKSFCSFLLSIPSHFRGVQRVELVAATAAAPARKLRIWEKDTGSSVEIAAETELL